MYLCFHTIIVDLAAFSSIENYTFGTRVTKLLCYVVTVTTLDARTAVDSVHKLYTVVVVVVPAKKNGDGALTTTPRSLRRMCVLKLNSSSDGTKIIASACRQTSRVYLRDLLL